MERTRISAASLAGERFSATGVAGSLLLHGLIIAATFVTLSHQFDLIEDTVPVVPVDLVTLDRKTNVMPTVRREPKIVPEVRPQPAPPAPPPPDQDASAEPAPSEPVMTKAPPPPVPQHRPQPAKPPDTSKAFDKLLASLDTQPALQHARTASVTQSGIGDRNAMTADLESMIRSKMAQCWTPPQGVPHPERLITHFDVLLNPNGTVQRLTQLSGQSDDPYSRAAADAARRAIYMCAPYNLPPDRYADWKEIEDFEFDPRAMNGE